MSIKEDLNNLKDFAFLLALKNAVKYDGKANSKALIGGLLGKNKELRNNMKELMVFINNIVNEVNSLSLEEQKNKLISLDKDFFKPKKKELKPLPGLEELKKEGKKIVLRFEPSPSGPLHIGHSYTLSLNLEYAKKYGDFILRISDTNPDNIDKDSYELIINDVFWLNKKPVNYFIQSDRINIYYDYALKLIKKNKAYVCTCSPDVFKDYKIKKKDCPCRSLSVEENIIRWERMLGKKEPSFNPGEAVLRYKSSMQDKNPAMRDFSLFRININPHPKQGKKYRVWPLMNFSVAIDDMLMEVTHTLRGKDHADNAKKQAMIHNDFNYKTPYSISVGRINFEGFPVSASKTREKIKKGEFEGWDDVRIPFLIALRRRGYQPDAFRKYALEVGVTQNDKTVHINEFFKQLNAFNKEIIDPIAKRAFFIKKPTKIKINNLEPFFIELDRHPDNDKGGRLLKVSNSLLIEEEDLLLKKGDKIRFMDAFTAEYLGNNNFLFLKKEYDKKDFSKIIHWLPEKKEDNDIVNIKVLMPDNNLIEGFVESWILDYEEGSLFQFERFGFVRFDNKKEKLFCFAHK